MKLSEAPVCEQIRQWLERNYNNIPSEARAEIGDIESKVAQLEVKIDGLRKKLVASEGLYISRGAEIAGLKVELLAERKNGLTAMLEADWITFEDWAEAIRALSALKEDG